MAIWNVDPILTKINSGWQKATDGENYKKAAKWLRLFVQYTKVKIGKTTSIPEEHQNQAHEMIAFLVDRIDNVDDKSASDVIQAIKSARRQLKQRVAYGTGFSQSLTDEERERASIIGRPIKLGFQDTQRAITPFNHSGDAILDNYLGSDESELD